MTNENSLFSFCCFEIRNGAFNSTLDWFCQYRLSRKGSPFVDIGEQTVHPAYIYIHEQIATSLSFQSLVDWVTCETKQRIRWIVYTTCKCECLLDKEFKTHWITSMGSEIGKTKIPLRKYFLRNAGEKSQQFHCHHLVQVDSLSNLYFQTSHTFTNACGSACNLWLSLTNST